MSRREIVEYTCDRCGKDITPRVPYSIFTRLKFVEHWTEDGSLHTDHLCDDCWKAFREQFMKFQPVAGRGDTNVEI